MVKGNIMSKALNKTTKYFITDVDTTDFDTSEWIIEPDLSLLEGIIPIKYWKINPDNTVTEMTAEEKVVVDNNIVQIAKGEPNKDYKYTRSKIMISVYIRGFANLTLEEKQLASKWFAVSKTDRDSVHTTEEQIKNGLEFHNKSVESREARAGAAKVEVYNRVLDGLERVDFMSGISDLLDNYIKYGIEGTSQGDVTGVLDYLQSTSVFVGGGLLAKTYTVVDMTIQQLSDRLIAILKDGDY